MICLSVMSAYGGELCIKRNGLYQVVCTLSQYYSDL